LGGGEEEFLRGGGDRREILLAAPLWVLRGNKNSAGRRFRPSDQETLSGGRWLPPAFGGGHISTCVSWDPFVGGTFLRGKG